VIDYSPHIVVAIPYHADTHHFVALSQFGPEPDGSLQLRHQILRLDEQQLPSIR
jgi:hypothetical protein